MRYPHAQPRGDVRHYSICRLKLGDIRYDRASPKFSSRANVASGRLVHIESHRSSYLKPIVELKDVLRPTIPEILVADSSAKNCQIFCYQVTNMCTSMLIHDATTACVHGIPYLEEILRLVGPNASSDC